MRLRVGVLCLCSLLFSGAALAAESQVFFESDLAYLSVSRLSKIAVETIDEVTEGCWVSASATKSAVELELIRSGFEITPPEDFAVSKLQIRALGFALSNLAGNDTGCAVYVSLSALILELNNVTSERFDGNLSDVYLRRYHNANSLLAGSKDNISRRIKETAIDMTKEFLVEIEKQKQALKKEISNSDQSVKFKEFWIKYVDGLE